MLLWGIRPHHPSPKIAQGRGVDDEVGEVKFYLHYLINTYIIIKYIA